MSDLIYLVSEGILGPIKVGRSRSLQSRLPALQTGNPRRLKVIATWEITNSDASCVERLLLDELKMFALVGEWLDVSERFILSYMPDFFGADGFEVKQI